MFVAGFHPRHSALGIVWTAATAGLMFLLSRGKAKTGAALENPVLRTEGRVTTVDGILASVLVGLVFNAALGWWWADPAAGYAPLYYGVREACVGLAH